MKKIDYKTGLTEWSDYRVLSREVSEHHSKKCKTAALRFENIANIELSEIRPADIMKSIQEASQKYKPESIRKAFMFGKMAFCYFIAMEYVESNPFDSVRKPKKGESIRKSLTKKQAKELYCSMSELFYSTGDIRPASIAILLKTGIRMGELLALDGSEINGGVLKIDKAVKDDGSIGCPKTKSSNRIIAVDEETQKLLEMSSPFAGNVTHSTINHWWRKWADANGYDGVVPHELRHTHATLLIASGVDIKTVQTRLGHSSAMTTLDIYSHAIDDKNQIAADKMKEIFS